MSARLLLLCPGQGGQHVGMSDLARTDPAAAKLLDECGLTDPDPATMFENRNAQPLIVGATLAMWEALRHRVPAPSLVAGYSLGELSAYGVAGAFEPHDAVRLATRRAMVMDAAAQATQPHALVAIGGLAVERASALAQAAGFHLAIITGHDTIIAGGLELSLPGLTSAVTSECGSVQRLPVGIASHTALLESSVAPFAQALQAAPYHTPACAVLAGISAERVVAKELAVTTLSRQLAETIVWTECMDAAAEVGITVALELGPGAALARMLQTRHPQIACRSVADFRSLDGIIGWLARQFD
jgi:[acyl-carrier-protein] S-malonyltransferase